MSQLLLDTIPLPCAIWDKDKKLITCNKKILEYFKLNDKNEFENRFFDLSPKYQPDGKHSAEALRFYVQEAFKKGSIIFDWMHCLLDGEPVPVEITLVRIEYENDVHLISYIRDLREQKQMAFELQHYSLLLQTLNQVAAALLDTEDTGFENNLYSSMDIIIRAVDADKISIWKNNIHNDELCATQLYEWSDENVARQAAEDIVNISYNKTIPDWEAALSAGQCVNGITRNMEPNSRDFLLSSNTMSVFVAPIFMRDDFWGFVGISNCRHEKIFPNNEAAILRSFCLLIGNAFLRGDMTQSLQENIKELEFLKLDLENALSEAKGASRSKSVFLANMSHEIRTPMNSIIGFSELALDDNSSPKVRNYLLNILDNSKWLLQIINDILDISKIESGKMELESIPFDLQEIFNACRTLVMPKAIEKGLTIHFYAEPSVNKKIYGDPVRLRQVLVNLLSNAVKFTNTGVIKMQAAIEKSDEDGITIKFEVKDSGIGIEEDNIKKIFDPFTQAESGTTRKFGGSGLGLAITKNIIDMMGGTLFVESIPGEGSRFYFEIYFNTLNNESGEEQRMEIQSDILEKPAFEGEVLICEDNAMNQLVICEHLSRVGLKTMVVQNGKQGVNLIKFRAQKNMKQFDLILMDIHMPVMDGIEAAEKIVEIDSTIPIVAMTANIMAKDKEIYISKGMTDCVGKPFTSQELWQCLLKYFKPIN